MTYRECYRYGLETLREAGIADAATDAGLLLEYICHISRHDMILYGDREMSEDQRQRYEECVARRSRRIPLQHITGEQAFMGFDFRVNEHVLIPRQDTEVLVEEALQRLKSGQYVLDMCTGSGCILLSLLALCEGTKGMGVDISSDALAVAGENATRVSAQCGRALDATFIESDLFGGLSAQDGNCRFDMIVSNPPYIASEVIATLEPEVRIHEPLGALDGRADGLYFYRRIVTESGAFLKEGGWLLFEIGHDQGEAVAELMREAGFAGVCVRKDYAGLDRVVYGFLEEEA